MVPVIGSEDQTGRRKWLLEQTVFSPFQIKSNSGPLFQIWN